MEKRTVGSIIYGTIDKNSYLQELYSNILHNYSVRLFGLPIQHKPVDIGDALRFADLLSKSTHPKKADSHKIMAQEIVALLKYIYPNDSTILHYLGSVLSNTGNFHGKAEQSSEYKSSNLLDRFYCEFAEDFMTIPAEPKWKFFRSQKQIYDKLGNSCLSYSGPTSMGKTLIMRMFIKEQLLRDAKMNFAIIVPTKALINEVSKKLEDDLQELLTQKNYKIVNSPGSLFLKGDHSFIFVITPERLLYLLTDPKNIRIDYLFIDEAHRISASDSRSAFYYKTVDMLLRKIKDAHTVFASPNIPNPQVYLRLLPEVAEPENALSSSFSPVSQIKYFIDFPLKKIYIYNKYTGELTEFRTIKPGFEITHIMGHIGKGRKNLIYCDSKAKTVELAQQFINDLKLPDIVGDKELTKLSKDIEDEIHENCYLANMVRKGIAYHVGFLPTSIRMRIEDLYKREKGGISTLFCTSTLVEGVNLPADNLFITSYYNGISSMEEVDFANLVGRVGRIEFNLYGNVFLTQITDSPRSKRDNFLEYIKGKVPEQELSIAKGLNDAQKQNIVDTLKSGSMELPRCPEKQSDESYELMRRFANILVRDITENINSLVYREFVPIMENGIEEQIRTHFKNKADKIDDDINVSVDQVENLRDAIQNEQSPLAYPALIDGYIPHADLFNFLLRLCRIFKWEQYEKKTLGKLCNNYVYNNRQCGQTPACCYCKRKDPHSRLSFYAVVLGQWLQGNGLKRIIEGAIDHKKNNPIKAMTNYDQSQYDYDHSSMEHRNIIISDTLEIVENIILFKISNYFLKMSAEYKRIHGADSLISNDWYDFVEYGTTNRTSIFFQRHEIERQTANYIKDNGYFVQTSNGDYRIKNSIKQCGKESIMLIIKRLEISAPELFID